MSEIDYETNNRPLIQTGEEFKTAVKFWKGRDEQVRLLCQARSALIRGGFKQSDVVTLELRRRLYELESMKADGRWVEHATI